MKLFSKTNFDFLGKRKLFFAVSAVMILVCIVSIVSKRGLNLGIDFTGGSLNEVRFDRPMSIEELRGVLSGGGLPSFELQSFPLRNAFIIKIKGTGAELETVRNTVQEILIANERTKECSIERTEYVGPTIGKYLTGRAVYAFLFSLAGIIVYVAIRFKSTVWGVSGVIALVHDVFITVGFLSLINREITLTVIAAVLTLAGYSINDTIVIFDRIRENLSLLRKEPLEKIMNTSINETLSRTVITSTTTLIVLVVMFFLGGDVLHDFSLTLLFGILLGTYSSVFVASPLVYEWLQRRSTARDGSRKINIPRQK